MPTIDPRTLKSSIRIYRELASRQPDNPLHHEQLGRLCLLAGRRQRGLGALERAARLRAARGDYPTAIEILREVMRIAPGRTETALLLAQLYAQAPQTAARVSVAAAVADDPLDDLARPDQDPPLDASSLIAVHDAEELGAEVLEDPLEDEPLDAPLAPAPDTRAHRVLRHALTVGSTVDATMTVDVIDDDDILQIVELIPDPEE
jgi:hypothetical protein